MVGGFHGFVADFSGFVRHFLGLVGHFKSFVGDFPVGWTLSWVRCKLLGFRWTFSRLGWTLYRRLDQTATVTSTGN
ncbi:hypothetical protein MKY15_03605 [Sporosarcina sp. FSL K6-1540]|uniref:hypothetical protein n=1 Tax=Sporosarcina sp. FSL K6-1540 TaxID=2921555 RepID=UPI00315A015C